MKTSKLTAEERYERRMDIMGKRDAALYAWRRRGITYVKYDTTRFDKHSSDRQRARYARQIAAGQLRMEGIANV